jgi:hypothetical protein
MGERRGITDLRDKSNQINDYLRGTGSETPHSPPSQKKIGPSFLYFKKKYQGNFFNAKIRRKSHWYFIRFRKI